MSLSKSGQPWWKSAVVYQIYPISFFDSNGDGFGDLNGIASKLDYLKDLGVDVLWLSPIYASPLADMGYDISDYRAIDPRYGTLEDWDRLLEGVHQRGMKLMMDLVVNHTSDEHQWFIESKSSKSSPKRDWYIWRSPKFDENGTKQPPNNWKSVFEGSAWDYEEAADEYYLHLYVAKQPDLNWDNPEVREAVWDVMKFWLNRGCDGFRMDVINLISKVEGLHDAPIIDPKEKFQYASEYYANGPRVHEYIKEMHGKVLSKHDLITVGETPFTHSSETLASYVLPANKELNMVFQFEIMDIDMPHDGDHVPLIHMPWKMAELKEIVDRWQNFKRDQGFWNAIFIENHDQARAVSRFGNDTTDELRNLSAKLLALFECTQSGTLYVYQGLELGMKNFPRSWGIEEYKDIASINYYNRILEQRKKESGKTDPDMADVLDGFQKKARDHARTPMQWNSTAHGGFTTGTPWMRVNDDYITWNAAAQLQDPNSVHAFWRKALVMRKQYANSLLFGDFNLLLPEHEHVFAYGRGADAAAVVLLNFSKDHVAFELPKTIGPADDRNLILSNYESEGEPARLRPFEGRVYHKL